MLSQIENGVARPSMETLCYLAGRLGKPVSFFLEEPVASPNQQCITEAKTAFALGELDNMRQALDAFSEPDDLLHEERQLLEFYWHLKRAKQALSENMKPYGVKLLYHALELDGLYITADLRYRCRVLLGMAGEKILLEADEEAILVRAMQCNDPQRRLAILELADDKTSSVWKLLKADALLEEKRYQEAAQYYLTIPPSGEVYEKLEVCYRELGDFKLAYEYACKQRQER
jgi:transcriptional regulator with XRE-family HTH domain